MARNISSSIEAEVAKEENRPIHLVEIELDSGILYFTDYDSDVVFPSVGGNTYIAKGMSFNPISTSLSMQVDEVEISFDNVDRSMSAYLQQDEFQGRWLTIKKVFANLLDDASNAVVLFSGKMKHPRVDESKFVITVTSILDSLKKQIPTRLYQAQCPWKFGGEKCGLDITKSPYKKTGTADASSTASKLVDAERTEQDNWWKYGILKMTSGANAGLKREILSSTSTGEINLLYTFPNPIAEGDAYEIQVGCKKTFSECRDKYNNLDNFGGFPSVAREVMKR